MQVTDQMVSAALTAYHKEHNNSTTWRRWEWTDEGLANMRAALEAALNAAPDATTDAEFAAALDELCGLAADAECTWQMRDWDSWEDVDGTFHAARARVEALHADARNAGLRELREWLEDDFPHCDDPERSAGYTAAWLVMDARIAAMLKEAGNA